VNRILSSIPVLFITISGALTAEPFQLGSNRHLFLDTFLLDEIQGATLEVNRPYREDLFLIADKPWETGGITSYGNILWDP
jgi:hypothetical protein